MMIHTLTAPPFGSRVPLEDYNNWPMGWMHICELADTNSNLAHDSTGKFLKHYIPCWIYEDKLFIILKKMRGLVC